MYNLRVNKLNGGTECLVVYLLVFAHFLFFSRSIIVSHSSMYQCFEMVGLNTKMCFISRLLIRFTKCYESFVYLVLEITATLEKNLRKHDVFSSTSRKFCSRNEKIYHTSNVNRVAKTKNTRLRWVGRISGNDTVFLFCFVFLLFYNYE